MDHSDMRVSEMLWNVIEGSEHEKRICSLILNRLVDQNVDFVDRILLTLNTLYLDQLVDW